MLAVNIIFSLTFTVISLYIYIKTLLPTLPILPNGQVLCMFLVSYSKDCRTVKTPNYITLLFQLFLAIINFCVRCSLNGDCCIWVTDRLTFIIPFNPTLVCVL